MNRPTSARSTKEATSTIPNTRTKVYSERSKSRSPSRSGRTDPFALSLDTAPTIKRKRSATPVRPSTTVDEVDRGHRIKPSVLSQPRVLLAPTGSTSHRPKKEREWPHAQPSYRVSDKGKGREVHRFDAVSPGFAGPAAAAEYERMRKEMETLKKAVHDSKKQLKKQSKTIEELKAQVVSETQARETARAEHEKQLALVSAKSVKNEELIQTIQVSLQCQICIELVSKPYAVVPCGHILCLECLQQWFRSAPSNGSDDESMDPETQEELLLTRDKSCPCCRARVTRRPIPIFLVKSLASALRTAGVVSTPSVAGAEEDDADPWKGLFLPEYSSSASDDEEEYHEYASFSDGELDDPMPLGMSAYQHQLARFYASGSEDSDGEVEAHLVDEDDSSSSAGENSDSDGEHHGDYSYARWEPPTQVAMDLHTSDPQFQALLKMQRRGCTPMLIHLFNMRYTHDEGLVLHVNSLDPHTSEADLEAGRNRLFVGWNLTVPEEEPGEEVGATEKQFVLRQLRDIRAHPERWIVLQRPGYNGRGIMDARRLAPMNEDAEVYDTSDSEAYVF
ncbi:hypothetical protein FB45DRAFT_752056 [Roridomyces roridus]|uniref:RING-type domain-containing protein n=1 Tax=Roridomyces roridus TaxID=1738132 RepID=A0AAD7BKJ7_9AGAR|nr:hypothetical protein FB45DRAFT_752056 [Roridomyces roridus]